MSEKYKFVDGDGMYFVTMATVGWVDLFTRWELKHVIIDSLRYCQKEKGLVIHAWCLMPSHLHMIVSTKQEKLSDIMRDFKKFTSKELIKTIERINESRKDWMLELFGEVADRLKRVSNYKVWRDGNHPELLYSAKFTQQKLDYIHDNPVADGIVDEPEEYRYSSARDYYSKRAILNWRLSSDVDGHAMQSRQLGAYFRMPIQTQSANNNNGPTWREVAAFLIRLLQTVDSVPIIIH